MLFKSICLIVCLWRVYSDLKLFQFVVTTLYTIAVYLTLFNNMLSKICPS